MKESEVQAIKEIEKRLKESELKQKESLVTEGTTLKPNLSTDGTTLDASLVTKGTTLEACLVIEDESSSSETTFTRSRNEDKESSSLEGNVVDADIGPSYDNGTVTEVPQSNNDTFENVFAYGIQNHEQPESIPDTYMVNENNSNIISDIPNMDPNRDMEEHDYVDYEQQCRESQRLLVAVLAVPDIPGGRSTYQGAATRPTLPFLSFTGEGENSKSSWPLNSLGAQVEVIKTLENSCPIGWFGIAKLSMRPCGCGDRWELRGEGLVWLTKRVPLSYMGICTKGPCGEVKFRNLAKRALDVVWVVCNSRPLWCYKFGG
ncbi:hypothetical protein Tco_0644119 [Tanacetum coccineum]